MFKTRISAISLKTQKVFAYSVILIGAISMLLPFLWLVAISLMEEMQIFSSSPSFIPHPFKYENYTNVFNSIPLTVYFLNSLLVATVTSVGQIVLASMSGYAFARFNIKNKNLLFFLILVTMMVPIQVNIVPLFFLMRELGWIDTYYALIVPGFFGGFGIFMMRQWFLGLPKEIEEAARIDGCNYVECFFKIILPSSVPALVTLSIFTFITTWNSFMWPLIVTSTQNMRTLPLGLSEFKGSFVEMTDWGQLSACCVISCIPVVLVFLLGKKHLINNLLSGSSK